MSLAGTVRVIAVVAAVLAVMLLRSARKNVGKTEKERVAAGD